MNVDYYFDEAQKVIDADQFGGQVWISGSKFAQNQKLVLEHKFAFVFACMETSFRYKNAQIKCLRFPIEQTLDCDIKAYFLPSFQVINAARKSGKVLIYSKLGISRSVTIMMAYLMQKYNKNWKEVLQILKSKRPCAQPPQLFLDQLRWFQKFILKRF